MTIRTIDHRQAGYSRRTGTLANPPKSARRHPSHDNGDD